MTRDIAIQAEGLSKSYQISVGSQRQRYKTLQEDVLALPRKLLGVFDQSTKTETFWALNGVSFEVKQGEVLGIIGRNGAGKSTLLKVLSRITEPTAGRAEIYGRVGSLLEVGTGFHPELTGRENTYLNGSILGMRRNEIAKHFDEIVAFAEVEKFIDTPVKRYSSGMYMRLAFAVAAHLEPEILIVDEVLAVGDAEFQKKCMGKMDQVAKGGRTVLFVSHNLQAVVNLCSRAIVLEAGSIIADDTPAATLAVYARSTRKYSLQADTGLQNRLDRTSGDIRFTHIQAQDSEGHEKWNFETTDAIQFNFSYKVFRDIPDLCVYIALLSSMTDEIITNFKHVVSREEILAGSESSAALEVAGGYLRPGQYKVYACLGNSTWKTCFDVIDQNVNIPYLTISSRDLDPHQNVGYATIPSNLIIESGQVKSYV